MPYGEELEELEKELLCFLLILQTKIEKHDLISRLRADRLCSNCVVIFVGEII